MDNWNIKKPLDVSEQAAEPMPVAFGRRLNDRQVMQAFKRKLEIDCLQIYRDGSYKTLARDRQPVFPSMLGEVYKPQQATGMPLVAETQATVKPTQARPMVEVKPKIKRSTIEQWT